MRKSGVLMPVASLPSRYGVGDFGSKAYEFIDIIALMRVKIWQVLPLTPLGFGNSPYQGYSSFAGDAIYISLDQLVTDGLLLSTDVKSIRARANTIDYPIVRNHKEKILKKAFAGFKQSSKFRLKYSEFERNTPWLTNYAVFLTLKKVNQGKSWKQWPHPHKNWINDKKLDLKPYQENIEYEKFLQFMFFRQWLLLKQYANARGIAIMGDVPIYIGFDSLDVWENQSMFLLDKDQNPTFVAGVPPDFFSKFGQRWGNPLYDWQAMEADGFNFWINRLRANTKTFDIIRIDHFRAFDTYWKIPAHCKTARDGEWVEAPGYKLFDTIYRELPDIKIVAEDLGDLRPQVLELRDHYNLPGMKVFQFLFNPASNNSELIDTVNTIIYTGTHDNSTLIAWYQGLKPTQKKQIRAYLKVDNNISPENTRVKQAILRYVLNSKAAFAILPIQDILGLDDSARINNPGTIGSPNWEWRLTSYTNLRRQVKFMARAVVNAARSTM